MWTTIVCTVIIVISLQCMASKAFMAYLKKQERKQREKIQQYKGTVKTLEEQANEEKKTDKEQSIDMKDFIGNIQMIVNTVLWLVEESGKDVGGWTTSDLMLLMNKFNECSGRKDGK